MSFTVIKVCLFYLSSNSCSANRIRYFVRKVIYCFLLSLWASLRPVSVTFSNPCYLIISSRYFKCLFLIRLIKVLYLSGFSKTTSIVIFSSFMFLSPFNKQGRESFKQITETGGVSTTQIQYEIFAPTCII